jgi:nucleoside-diphosphate-sugar epimerase
VKTALVTGASGFIGRHCLGPLVARGYRVHAAALGAGLPVAEVTWHDVDLLDQAQRRALIAAVRPTHLLHLAWETSHGQFWSAASNLAWLHASLDLLMSFQQQGGMRAVAAGTCAEYDWREGYCSEDVTRLRPATLYGACKHALHQVQEALCRQHGLQSAWGRVFHLFGPHEHPDRLVPSVTRALLAGERARCSHGEQIRDFLYVEDVAQAFVVLLDSDLEGAVNICSGLPVAIKDVVGRIADKLACRHLLEIGALPSSRDAPAVLVGTPGRLFSDCDWRPTVDLDTGLDRAIAWWRQRSERANRLAGL